MRIIASLADSLLGTVAPRIKAEANCGMLRSFTVPCGCLDGKTQWIKTCLANFCISNCTPCEKTNLACSA